MGETTTVDLVGALYDQGALGALDTSLGLETTPDVVTVPNTTVLLTST